MISSDGPTTAKMEDSEEENMVDMEEENEESEDEDEEDIDEDEDMEEEDEVVKIVVLFDVIY